MRTYRRLGLRVSATFLGFSVFLTVSVGIGVTYTLRLAEREIIDDTLASELAHVRERLLPGQDQHASSTRTTSFFVAPGEDLTSVPEHLRNLAPGTHDLAFGAHDYRVLVADADSLRFYVQYDDSDVVRREREFVSVVLAIGLATLLVAILVGWVVSYRISRPVTALADAVTRLREQTEFDLDLSLFRDDEVGFLAREVRKYNHDLRDLLTREKEFAGNVSHELRTPVTNISLAAEVLAAGSPSEKDAVRIERIRRGAREISELIDTFLVLSRIDDQREDLQSSCDVAAIVDDVVIQQSVWLGDKPVAVEVRRIDELRVRAPVNVVNVAIANLVRNSFRYTNEGRISIAIDNNSLTVTDTGVGIPGPVQARLFDRHVRAETGDRDGAGLGLSIVRRICDRYGWRVSFSSSEGKGTRFCLDFSPVSGPRAEADA